ncbi:serine carboxypeptidase-like 31 [Phoenix dactylifera]|uniref:Serine carboxypeptidase-like 31 n=1 Tax=Phoenix dactylifera TaxID=42345 RepID=A0A8B9A4G9_PHODC|nr:serine carboxypeptidase-like 31 [Phoenix dactylifera]
MQESMFRELAELIYDMNKNPSLFIDLKGFLLGNPETSDSHDWQVWWIMLGAMPSSRMQHMTSPEITANLTNSSGSNNGGRRLLMFKSTSKMIPRIMGSYDPCLDGYTTSFYNRPDVQKALHASDGHNIRNWSICNKQIFNEWKDSMPSVLPIYKKLIAGGLRIWVYSGDTDGRVPVLSTRYCLDTLGIAYSWSLEAMVAGWLQEYEGLTFATFRGAGHDVPTFKPSSSLAFFTAFLAGKAPSSTR